MLMLDPSDPTPDREAAERFLQVLDPTATRFTFQTFDDDKERKDKTLARVIHGTLAERFNELAELNTKGAGVFITVNATNFEGRTAANITNIRALFVDLDGAPVPKACPRPHAVVETSPGRFHVYWRVDSVSLAEFSAKQKALAARFSGDPSVHDLPRVMRLPGFYHRKGEPRLVRLIDAADIAAHGAAAFAAITADEVTSEMIRQDERRTNGGEVQSLWMKLNSAALANLNKWVPELFGSNAIFQPGTGAYRVSSNVLGRSLEEDLSIAPSGIKDWGVHDMGDAREGRRTPIDVVMAHGERSFEDAVAWLRERVVNSEDETGGDQRQQADEASRQKAWRGFLPPVDLSGWDDVPVPEQEWAVQDRIPLHNAFLLSGEGAAGKSLLQLQLSVATVLHREWLGTVPQQGPAIFIDAEDPIGVIHKRLADILRHYEARFADVKDNLHLVSLAGKDAVLATFSRMSNRIEATPLYKRLLEMAGDIKPKTIGIASSADVFAGSEVDRSQVQQFVAMLTRVAMRIEGSLVLISHPSLTGMASGSGISGSTQWHNSVRARAFLHGVKAEGDEPPDTDMRILEFKKNNYGPLTESVVLKYQRGLFLPVAGTSAEQAERNQRAEDVYLLVLRKLIDQNQDLSIGRNASNYAPAKIAADPAARGFRRQDMEAAQQRLLDQHRIHIVEEGPPSKRRKRVLLGPGPDPSEEAF
jgi:RecA-family ATPase